jgi:hypothetical protein
MNGSIQPNVAAAIESAECPTTTARGDDVSPTSDGLEASLEQSTFRQDVLHLDSVESRY